MIIYVTNPDQERSVEELPSEILKEQLVACIHVLEHLAGRRQGLANHPCVQMWRGHGLYLMIHAREIDFRLSKEGIEYGEDLAKATVALEHEGAGHPYDFPVEQAAAPHWVGDERVHTSHRSRLLTNHPDAVRHLGWTEPQHMSIHWPGPTPRPRPTPAKPEPETAPEGKGEAEAEGITP